MTEYNIKAWLRFEHKTYTSVNWTNIDKDSGMLPASWFPERNLTEIEKRTDKEDVISLERDVIPKRKET